MNFRSCCTVRVNFVFEKMEKSIEIPTLTENHILEILEKRLKTNNFKFVGHTISPIGEWVGLCGDHALLHATVEIKNIKKQLVFFVKLFPKVQSIIDFIEGTGSFRKEVFIYQLFEKMQIKILSESVPECYLTIPNQFLVMENLMQQGYTSMNKFKCFDFDTIQVVLVALAKLHASSLIYEEIISAETGKKYRLIDDFSVEFEECYYNDKETFPNKHELEAAFVGVLNCIEIFNVPKKLLSGKNFRDVLKTILHNVFTTVKPSSKYRNVICHGDLWATNVLIKFNEEQKPISCKLVDFQCGRYAPPAQDVMSVIYLTTSREFRSKHMYNLIGAYYGTLEKLILGVGLDIKKIVPFDDFIASCNELKEFALVQAATYFPLILMESKEVQNYFGNTEANKKSLYEDRSLLVLEQMNKNLVYKTRIQESIQDLKDYCDYL